jgi:hypothetical protein
MIYLVFAGNISEYKDFVAGRVPLENYVFVNAISKAYGYDWSNCEIVKVGTWYENEEVQGIIDDLEDRIRIAKAGKGKL